MNKKRDALRRGIRDLIETTSRDLAAFEGREPRPDTGAPGARIGPEAPSGTAAPGGPALNGGAAGTAADRAAPPAERSPAPPAHAAGPEPTPFQLIAEPAFLPPAATAGKHPSARRPAPRPAPSKRTKPARPAPRKARRERAAAAPASDDAGADATSPPQVQPRTGVCRSYFINHECWRVPTAYCNTALQVCVIRKCPVYELNKDILERRFAKKFKHFW